MTTAIIIFYVILFAVLCAFCAFCIWLILFIIPRDHDEALADHDWHKCAWCKCYFHAKSGVMQMTKPKYAPTHDSHGMCPDCFVSSEKDFSGASGAVKDNRRISSAMPDARLSAGPGENLPSPSPAKQSSARAFTTESTGMSGGKRA